MYADKLKKGDTIGIVCPSHIATPERYAAVVAGLESLGFRVKLGANIFKDTYGYLASEAERAEDFNGMVRDDEVKMVLFGGGEGGPDLPPYLDYEAIRAHPKLYSSYSDGTTLLNAIYAKTGLVTYYGQGNGEFDDLRYYDYRQFAAHFLQEHPGVFEKNSQWVTLTPGVCEGLLIGGYTMSFALLLGNPYFPFDLDQKYLLFLEDHEMFSNVAAVSAYLSCIEQSVLMGRVTGLLFGHYAQERNEALLGRLRRFGEKHGIPVAYCDDFGHGKNHGILPIGMGARMDSLKQTLEFL